MSDESPSRTWLTQYNRDWHAIIEHEGLARIYEKFLRHDYDNNTDGEGLELMTLPAIVVPGRVADEWAALERARPFEYFPKFDEQRQFTVTPCC